LRQYQGHWAKVISDLKPQSYDEHGRAALDLTARITAILQKQSKKRLIEELGQDFWDSLNPTQQVGTLAAAYTIDTDKLVNLIKDNMSNTTTL
jgi:hypothetical protein